MKTRHMILLGWILFTLSATGYIIASVGDFWAMFGSICFLVACLVFLAAYFKEGAD
ncbi:cytochrome oxidase subunit III [Yoonia sp. 2307UL14-13]|uniref:cytochrome oxidase subunit III n=1 Tax=Yoonia sp. 2307UL14-13 TaxID=3126506 RepID=UPI00309DE72C